MLGIRLVSGVALDLWVGASKDFDCAQMLEIPDDRSLKDLFTELFSTASNAKSHLGLKYGDTRECPFLIIRDLLKDERGTLAGVPRRITFVFSELNSYEVALKKMQELFQEDDL